MDRTRWGRIEEIFELAHAQPVAARQRFLAAACGSDGTLRDEIDAMLAAAVDDRALAVERLIVDRSPEPRDTDPWLGTCLGPWRLLDVLGRGGMGTVYRAERADGQYQQEVALKLVRSGPRDPYAIERLRTERQVLAHLRHPNIAGLLDGGFAADGTPYLVMELVDGVLENGSDIGLEGIRAQRSWIVFAVGRSAEALDAASRAVSAIEGMKDPNDGHVLAYSRIVLARILSETGRPDAAEPAARAAAAWFERWGRDHPQLANAECEVGRALVLQGRTAEGRARLEHCLPIYRPWGHADPHSVQSLDRLLTDAARAGRSGQRQP
jgi:Protein kinase domain/Tetratricopeptide repeat